MRYSVFALLCAMLAGRLFAAGPGPGARLGDPVEVFKLPKSALPPLSSMASLVRLSPDGSRAMLLRLARVGEGVTPHVGPVQPAEHIGPVPWDGHGIKVRYAQLALSGNVWRADGQRVLFLHPRMRDEGGFVPDYERTLSPWAMCWDLNNPQCKLCRHMRLGRSLSCTAVSYGADGKTLWTAFSDLAEQKRGGITMWSSARKRGGKVYDRKGVSIFRLAPSPDGKRLAWIEQAIGPDKKARPTKLELVVFDVARKKAVRRVPLDPALQSWQQVCSPVWSADSSSVCYDDVELIDRDYRHVARMWKPPAAKPVEVARDAVVVGVTSAGFVLNGKPISSPDAQSRRVGASPHVRHRTMDAVVLHTPAGLQTLVPDAYAQQADGNRIVYATISGDDVLIMTVRLTGPSRTKRPGTTKQK